MKKLTSTEDQDHEAFFEWAMTVPILRDYLYHIPNQRMCSIRYRVKLRDMGQRKGIVDFNLPVPNKKYCGMWMELKREGLTMCSVTKEQKEWLAKMEKLGHFTCVAFGFDEAVSYSKAYLRDI
jgi:hypothetical protein